MRRGPERRRGRGEERARGTREEERERGGEGIITAVGSIVSQ